jgi:hypothetical protein
MVQLAGLFFKLLFKLFLSRKHLVFKIAIYRLYNEGNCDVGGSAEYECNSGKVCRVGEKGGA